MERTPRTFIFNGDSGDVCPCCKTSAAKPTLLIPIYGTEDGGNIEAKQIHFDCMVNNLYYYAEKNIVAGVLNQQS